MEGERQQAQPMPAEPPHDPFTDLLERHRAYERDLSALANEAETILQQRDERARADAARILLEARAEAARLLTAAREEVSALTEQVAALRQAQREAADALQHTRRALDDALGPAARSVPSASAPSEPSRPSGLSDPSAPFGAQDTPRTAPRTVSLSRVEHIAASPPLRVRRSKRRAVPIGLAATLVAVAAIAALWIWGRERSPEAVSPGGRDVRERVAAVAPPKTAALRQDMPPSVAEPAAAPAAEPSAGPAAAERHTAPPDAPPLTIDLEARRPVWLRATIDGRQGMGGTLQAGRRRRITATDAVIIRTGDAGALMFSVNGGEPKRFGSDGAVRTRRFGSAVDPPPSPAVAQAERDSRALRPGVKEPPSGQRSETRSDLPVAATAGVSAPPALGVAAPTGTAPLLDDAAAGRLRAPAGPPPAPPAPRQMSADPRGTDDVSAEIVEADRRWFDAYYRGDRAAVARLSAEGFDMTDGRPADSRVPAGVRPERVLVDPRIDVHGDGAVLSGRMIERAASNGTRREYESFVSQVWVRRDGTWRLLGLRLAAGDALREAAVPRR